MVEPIADLIGRYLLAAAEYAAQWEGRLVPAGTVGVRRANRAADDLRKTAQEIACAGESAIRTFGRLLDEPRNRVRIWAAYHVLDLMTAPPDVVTKAFAVLEDVASGDDLEAMGARSRLPELRLAFGLDPTSGETKT